MDANGSATVYAMLFRKDESGNIEVALGLNRPKKPNKATGHPGRGQGWGIVAGGVESGETPLEAAARECDEESGFPESLVRDLLVPYPSSDPFEVKEGHQKYFFIAEIPHAWADPDPHDPEELGVTCARWFPLDTILVQEHEVELEYSLIYNSHRRLIRWHFRGTERNVSFTQREERETTSSGRRNTSSSREARDPRIPKIPGMDRNNIYSRRAARGKRK